MVIDSGTYAFFVGLYGKPAAIDNIKLYSTQLVNGVAILQVLNQFQELKLTIMYLLSGEPEISKFTCQWSWFNDNCKLVKCFNFKSKYSLNTTLMYKKIIF